VTFGAFVEILPGVEGLVHISELAQHHVENPREVVSQGDAVAVKIIEVDADRRRLSLSLKRVEPGEAPEPLPGQEAPRPQLDLSEDVFADEPLAEAADAALEERAPEAEAAAKPEAETVAEAPVEEAEAPAELPTAEAETAEPEASEDVPEADVPEAGETPPRQAAEEPEDVE
ncbi:MAG TPA: S1 RNA-binding domain-containing protein, partial [Gaiellaceae bacterium]